MKYSVIFLLVLTIFSACKETDSHIDFFSNVTIEGDSINLLLKMGESQEIATSKGTMRIFFEASELCAQSECATCDVSASVDFFLIHESDTVKTPTIRLYRCGQDLPIIYKTVSCTQADFGSYGYHFTKYGKLIYNIKELFPYPETREEVFDFYFKNLYNLKLTILNAC